MANTFFLTGNEKYINVNYGIILRQFSLLYDFAAFKLLAQRERQPLLLCVRNGALKKGYVASPIEIISC